MTVAETRALDVTSAEGIANQLRLVRSACRRWSAGPMSADAAAPVVAMLDRLIAELGAGAEARVAAAAALAPETPGVDYAESARATGAALSAETSLARLREIVAVDHRHWLATEMAIQREVAKSGQGASVSADAAGSEAAIDLDAFTAFVRAHFPDEANIRATAARVASEGFSKKTVFVDLADAGALPETVVLRIDKAFSYLGTTIRDEAPALARLFAHGAPVPRVFAADEGGTALGQPFLMMSKAEGGSTGKSYFPPARNDRLTAAIAASLARIHAVPVPDGVAIGAARTDDRPYIAEEVDRYEATWRALGAACPTIDAALAWVRGNMGAAFGTIAIVHNDFDYHNLIVDGDRVTAVVDWEFVHLGNPAADIGYFEDSAEQTGGFERFLAAYVAAGGVRPRQDELDFYILWGHARLAIMSFQTEQAFLQGRLEDPRYALAGVHFLRRPILALGHHLARILDRQIATAPPARVQEARLAQRP